MSTPVEQIREFIEYARTLNGDEKGEAQVFCDRLFRAFGHGGYKEAGATLEFRVKAAKSTKFADLLWRPRLLMEMKKRGEKLQKHYSYAFEYWLQLVPQRPKYVILCNFDEFWIYDFDSQLDDPVDRVALEELPRRYNALNFLFPVEKTPQFQNNRVDVTRAAAADVAGVFNSLVARGEDRESAQRFALQCVVAMFSEDADLLPKGLFSELLDDCRRGASTYDLLGGLFRQMNSPTEAPGGRYKGVRYFNGGIFQAVQPLELNPDEIDLLLKAAAEDWSKVQPPIFGTLFQSSMGKERRHAFGAHFTSETDIQKVVLPTIVRPWRERIEAARRSRNFAACWTS
ncbi:class I SAM-dependent DNA methyltransferase [Paludisphaera soli]|uniref:class I SAM-dependent DNA methyltransferase n=1 Tax=Paludisphaera soli TaxID=2712865 RepID=UPI0019810DA6|nr:class I SAM-dependent DNA methyltransferase [Paludisphaera soli]